VLSVPRLAVFSAVLFGAIIFDAARRGVYLVAEVAEVGHRDTPLFSPAVERRTGLARRCRHRRRSLSASTLTRTTENAEKSSRMLDALEIRVRAHSHADFRRVYRTLVRTEKRTHQSQT